MSTNVGSIHYDLSINTSDFDSKASKLGASLSSLGKKMAVGVGVAGAALTAFGVSSVKSFQESENAAAQLNAVLKSTKGVAGVTADQADKLATQLQKVTRFSDEVVLSGENMLLTFTNIGKDIFPQATETMLDMSQALGQDVKTSAIQLGKALQDPINGVTALRRVGVNFSDAQQEVIKKLVESGKAAEAQKLILQELQVEFGGSARAAGETFAGKMDILKNSFDNVKESIGKTLVNALTPLALQLSNFVSSDKFQKWLEELNKWIAIHLPMAINWMKDTGIPLLKAAFDVTWPVIKTVTLAFIDLLTFLKDNMWILAGVVTYLGLIKAGLMMQGAISIFQGGMAAASASASGLNSTLAFMASSAGGFALVGAAAIAAGVIVTNKWKETADVINKTKLSAQDAENAAVMASIKINKAYQEGKIGLEKLYKLEQGLGMSQTVYRQQVSGRSTYIPGFASGTNYAPGGLAVVGEQGPELVNLPRGAQVKPNNESIGSTTINLNMQGIMARSRSELRDIAKDMLTAVNEELRAKGKVEIAI